MKYLMLVQKDEAAYRALSDRERDDLHARYAAHGRRMVEAGVLRGGAVLDGTATATTLRVRDSRRLVTDGPFAESSEQIAGVCIIEVADLDEALAWAADHPDAAWGSVEVRPILGTWNASGPS